ncbi:MAG: sigma-70 family RNA polymerase sigma factor [Deltaproteobacteria bacterium]|nr:sigma-70 family RNA polymerase sigma factor [Nannocystaceae bacterium]
MSTDFDLLAGWRGGDKSAGSELFRRYFDALYRFFVGKLPDEAEDLIQSTWMACVRYTEQVAAATSFRAYLFTMARNELCRALRQRKPREQLDFGVTSLRDLSPSPRTAAAAGEEERALLAALRTLPLDLQLLLELHYWEELSTSELAGVLEIPQGTVKTRIRRARELLESALASSPRALQGDELDEWVRSMRRRAPAPT